MKKKIIMFSAATLLLLGLCSITFAGNKVLRSFQIDTGDGIFGNKIPCWSAGNNPQGCTGTYVECSTCTRVSGLMTGGPGECKP